MKRSAEVTRKEPNKFSQGAFAGAISIVVDWRYKIEAVRPVSIWEKGPLLYCKQIVVESVAADYAGHGMALLGTY